MDRATLNLAQDGAAYFASVYAPIQVEGLRKQLEQALAGRPGTRLTGNLFAAVEPMTRVATGLIGEKAFPVRAVAFDKTPDMNWALAWHQDRTIAVRERIEVDGFGPWSTKAGVPHVAPPMAILDGMITLRLHLDDCDEDNAPLKVALGSHRLGLVPADQAAKVSARCPQLSCHAVVGDVWAYATPILHASERSLGHRRRRVLHIDYATAALPGGLTWRGID